MFSPLAFSTAPAREEKSAGGVPKAWGLFTPTLSAYLLSIVSNLWGVVFAVVLLSGTIVFLPEGYATNGHQPNSQYNQTINEAMTTARRQIQKPPPH